MRVTHKNDVQYQLGMTSWTVQHKEKQGNQCFLCGIKSIWYIPICNNTTTTTTTNNNNNNNNSELYTYAHVFEETISNYKKFLVTAKL